MLSVTTETVWRDFAVDLRRFVARRVPASATDDVVQDIFLRIHDRLGQLQDEDRLGAWLFRVARGVISDHLGRARAMDPEPELASEPATEGDPRASLAKWLATATAALPQRYRDALEIVELQGATSREAAERLGLSVPGVKSRVQRGRGMLADRLRRCCHVELDARGGVMDYRCRRSGCCDTP